MNLRSVFTLSIAVLSGCGPGFAGTLAGDQGSSDNHGNGGGSAAGGGGSTGGGHTTGGGPATGGGAATGGGPATGGGSASGGGAYAGNPDRTCSQAIPPEGSPADVSRPTAVVGTGSAASCTFAALKAAVEAGGVVTFNCGSAPVTISVTTTMNLPIGRNTVIDGGRKIALDGHGAVQILRFESPNFQALDTRVTLQHITLINGMIAGSNPIPSAPAPCSQGFNDGEGGAVFIRDGNLSVIDSVFIGNQAAPLGPDVAGGAIRMLGSKNGIVIVGSTFRNNSASNGAAVGCLFSPLAVYNSLFENNLATGNGANSDDASKCNVINNGQHEVGSGGNGGALYSDGNSVDVSLCADKIVNNAAGANAFGGGLFFTSNNFGGDLSIVETTMMGNTGGSWTISHGGATNAGTAVGTNTHSLTITNSTLQGLH